MVGQDLEPGAKRRFDKIAGSDFGRAKRGPEGAGAAAVGWDKNGDVSYEFAETERYMGLFHEVAPQGDALNCNSCHNGGTRLDFAALGYTPNETRIGKNLCASCHKDESDEWSQSELFARVHDKHVADKGYKCNQCHTFDKAN